MDQTNAFRPGKNIWGRTGTEELACGDEDQELICRPVRG